MKKTIALLALSIFTAALAEAREISDLSGKWRFKFGNEAETSVLVPHTWNAEDACAGPKSGKHTALSVQSKSYKRGNAIYTRTLPVKPQAGKRYFIRGEGASIVSKVFINGKPAGTHEGAFQAFCYEITDLLKAETQNTISVHVDNSYNDNVLPLSGDFSMFGGLYRPIALIETDSVCIDPAYFASPGVFITQKKISKSVAEIEVNVRINSGEKSVPAKVSVKILDAKKNVVATGKTDGNTPAKISIKSPKLWQGHENPYLYNVVISLKASDGSEDEIVQPLGLRDFSMTPDKGFTLNGKSMTLHGVNRHQDREGKGWAVSAEDETQDIEMMVEMGANALRTAHYPQTTHIYDLCDKAGLAVWSEVSAIERVRDRPEFIANMKKQATEMVLQNYNHPSIVVWGLFNEIYHQTSAEDRKHDMIKVLSELNETIKSLDPTRPTVGNSNQIGNKKLNNIGDIFCANVYPGWYGGGPDRMGGMLDGAMKTLPEKAFGLGEYGHGADISDHEFPVKQPKPTSPWHPEEWQSYAHEINYKAIKARPQIWGTFIWAMFDFATAERIEGAKAGMNDKGLVTYDRKTRKDAFYFYKANWNPEPMIHLTSKRFTKRPATPEAIDVKAYTNCEKAELFINGKRIGSAEKPDDLKTITWKNVSLKKGENKIEVRGYNKGKHFSDSCVWTRE